MNKNEIIDYCLDNGHLSESELKHRVIKQFKYKHITCL